MLPLSQQIRAEQKPKEQTTRHIAVVIISLNRFARSADARWRYVGNIIGTLYDTWQCGRLKVFRGPFAEPRDDMLTKFGIYARCETSDLNTSLIYTSALFRIFFCLMLSSSKNASCSFLDFFTSTKNSKNIKLTKLRLNKK